MSRRRPLTPYPLRVLALLVLADGAEVSGCGLRYLAWPAYEIGRQSLRVHLQTLRAHGVRIARRQPGRRPMLYRLTELPPDDVLDVLLPMMHAVKAELGRRRLPLAA